MRYYRIAKYRIYRHTLTVRQAVNPANLYRIRTSWQGIDF